jgi:hypothetical protein
MFLFLEKLTSRLNSIGIWLVLIRYKISYLYDPHFNELQAFVPLQPPIRRWCNVYMELNLVFKLGSKVHGFLEKCQNQNQEVRNLKIWVQTCTWQTCQKGF